MNLSVVVPTCNRRDSLERTLRALGRQTFPSGRFEVVVVSDGSSDGTDEMLASLTDKVPYALRPIFQPNSGPSAARNRGILEARHPIIVFLDDDVEPVSVFLERHAAHHIDDDKAVVLGPMSPDPQNWRNEPVWIAWEHAKLQQTYDYFRPGGEYAASGAGPVHFYSGNASVRKQWLDAVGGFDTRFTRQEDVEMATRLAKACGVGFRFDFHADGLHRPQRTWDSWLRIPHAYGTLDAERVQAGQIPLNEVYQAARRRNAATRAMASVCLVLPRALPGLTKSVRRMATSLHDAGRRNHAISLLSALYNTCYIYTFHRSIRRMLTEPYPPPAVDNELLSLASSPAGDQVDPPMDARYFHCNSRDAPDDGPGSKTETIAFGHRP